ncbi:spore coat protein [Neobacillus vireti]|uniref:spore coat protein n=1 Tax=Neobacillus vireti TaxID=220686 RepID=UPI002FFF2C2C
MQNQQGQMHQNMHTGNIPQNLNHGGHEVLDVHEVLRGSIGTMNQYMMLSQHVKDPELLDIMNRQYRFMQDEYNITVECFRTGQEPPRKTQTYMMNQNNDFVYGLKTSSPMRPMQNVNEISDEFISDCMLTACKTGASMKTLAALESTNPVVRRVLADSVPNCIEMAYEISLYQNKRHYYQVPQFGQQDMTQMSGTFAPAQGMPMQQMANMNMNNMNNMGNMNH